MDDLLLDIRYALRAMMKRPGFAAIAVLTFALGIGANSAIFTVVNGVLLNPLPFTNPDQIVRVSEENPKRGITGGVFSPQDYDDIARDQRSFARMASYFYTPGLSGVNITGRGEPMRAEAAAVSGSFFNTLGTSAIEGRALGMSDDVKGSEKVVVLSEDFWSSRFGRAPIIGRTIQLDGAPFMVVGVMPRAFQYPAADVQIWMPVANITDEMVPHQRGIRWLEVIGRLKPGVEFASAQRNVDNIVQRLERAYPEANEGWTQARLQSISDVIVGKVRPALLVLLGAVVLVLLVACANLANLLLARATTRSSELAIRTAIGASRGRILRQLLTEYVVLAVAGGALGLVLSGAGVQLLVKVGANSIPRPDQIHPDARVIVFTLVVSVVTGLLAGILPALRAARTAPQHALKEFGRGVHGGRHAARDLLVVAETALAVILLAGATLMIRSLYTLTHVDPGFKADNVLTLQLSIPDDKIRDAKGEFSIEATTAYRNQILSSISQLPGVVAVGASKTAALRGGGEPYKFTLPEDPDERNGITPDAGAFIITPNYFNALQIPIKRGRDFTERDGTSAPAALIVNAAAARRFWRTEDVVGKSLRLGKFVFPVIGVVADVRNEGLMKEARPAVYVPIQRFPRSSANIFVRTRGNPLTIIEPVRRAVWGVNPNQPIASIGTLHQSVSETVAQPRFFTSLLVLFGALALVLAALGLYGVLSYAVGQRTREIGLRMALGANSASVVGEVLGHALRMTVVGLVLGIGAALMLTRVMQSQLYQVSATDPLTFMSVPVFLIVIAVIASLAPAARAVRVDPMVALRSE